MALSCTKVHNSFLLKLEGSLRAATSLTRLVVDDVVGDAKPAYSWKEAMAADAMLNADLLYLP